MEAVPSLLSLNHADFLSPRLGRSAVMRSRLINSFTSDTELSKSTGFAM